MQGELRFEDVNVGQNREKQRERTVGCIRLGVHFSERQSGDELCLAVLAVSHLLEVAWLARIDGVTRD